MTVAIVHPRMLSKLPGFFPASVAIQAKTATLDGYGQEVESWATVSDWSAIDATKAPLTAMERQAAKYTATDVAWHVLLAGPYPTITTAHRAVIDGDTFDIDASETDQTGSITRLRIRQITI